MSATTKNIHNFKEFHSLVPKIAKEINRDPQLAIRAMANPLLAIKEMGYKLPREVEVKIEKFIRFSPEERRKMKQLEQKSHKLAGKTFDLDSPQQIEAVLFRDLALEKPKGMKTLRIPERVEEGAKQIYKENVDWTDPLESLRDAHKIIAPLLEYRKLMFSKPGFASETLYHQLKSDERRLPISGIRIDFSERAQNHEEIEDA